MDALGSSAQLRVQMPLRLDNFTEPEPDLAVVLPRSDFYRGCHPTSADVILLVEVSQSSMSQDGKVKIPLYARHGVPEVWLVDLPCRQLHLFRSPQNGVYTDVSISPDPGVTGLAALPGKAVDPSPLFRE